jgi:glycosyltransferase involved in cell wall biosynthesis
LNRKGALVIMPTPAARHTGPVAVWITAAGWAQAAQRRWGAAWVVTPEGVLSPQEALRQATEPGRVRNPRPSVFRSLPVHVSTLWKDVRSIGRAIGFRNKGLKGPWANAGVAFVWQHHELFQRAGFAAARRFGVPLVLFVDAPVIWEMAQWGVRRPGWGRLLERFGESPQLREADLVLCVSETVAREACARGARPDRVLVTPCAVDAERFGPGVSGDHVRERHGLTGRHVVGWVGSFRRFHGVDLALQALKSVRARIPTAALLLVGDGPERPRVQQLAKSLGLEDAVVFTGSIGYDDVPAHIAAMDTCLVLDAGFSEFHYSPLKLMEYLASGRPVIAPATGQVQLLLTDRENALLINTGDVAALVTAIQTLYVDGELARRLGSAGRSKILQEGTWDYQLQRMESRLAELGLVS